MEAKQAVQLSRRAWEKVMETYNFDEKVEEAVSRLEEHVEIEVPNDEEGLKVFRCAVRLGYWPSWKEGEKIVTIPWG